MANRLAESRSLYLRQHADNPVDWHPWDDEAWALAKRLDRPVFLSVGYSTCHWCHVMAHESFEDRETADALNRSFISIKLDREERPDLDETFMTAVQIASGRGGWPMTVFLTPAGEPFFAGTYFPKQSSQGHPGFLQIVHGLASAWSDDRESVMESAGRFASALRQVRPVSIPVDQVTCDLVDQAVQEFHEQFDHRHGGFGGAPKFPPYTVLGFLLDYVGARPSLPGFDPTAEVLVQQAGHMALETMAAMARGGIRDHAGGGFHRYATDEKWHVPHFEKMLYDNALLLGVFGRERSSHPMFGEVADQTAAWMESALATGDGVYGSGLDADSDGEEGRYYTWDFDSVSSISGEGTAVRYGCRPEGNFDDPATERASEQNILYLGENELRSPHLDALAQARALRLAPDLDPKGVAAWNGFAISGLVSAGHIDLAVARAEPWARAVPDLPHIYGYGADDLPGFLDDFAALGIAFADIADATGDAQWESKAKQVCAAMLQKFGDGAHGFRYSQQGHANPFGDGRQHMHNPTPAPNALAVRLLRRVAGHGQSVLALSQIAGWAVRVPTACATILSECIHHMLAHGGDIAGLECEAPAVTLRYGGGTEIPDSEGFTYATLVVCIPPEHHVPTFQPAAAWLVPTAIEVEGAYAEAGFPEPDGDWYEGEVEVDLRLKALLAPGQAVRVTVKAQVCSDTACYPPQSVTLTLPPTT